MEKYRVSVCEMIVSISTTVSSIGETKLANGPVEDMGLSWDCGWGWEIIPRAGFPDMVHPLHRPACMRTDERKFSEHALQQSQNNFKT